MRGGPRRLPCPGMGKEPSEITMMISDGRGRGQCPDCGKDCVLLNTGKVGYHTSDLSKPRRT